MAVAVAVEVYAVMVVVSVMVVVGMAGVVLAIRDERSVTSMTLPSAPPCIVIVIISNDIIVHAKTRGNRSLRAMAQTSFAFVHKRAPEPVV